MLSFTSWRLQFFYMKRGGGVKSKYCQSDLLNHQRYNIPYELNQKYRGGGEQASPV